MKRRDFLPALAAIIAAPVAVLKRAAAEPAPVDPFRTDPDMWRVDYGDTTNTLADAYRRTSTKLYEAFKNNVEEFSWLDDVWAGDVVPTARGSFAEYARRERGLFS